MSSMSSSSAYSLDRLLMLYCFPAQLVVGLAGNTLNLIVLGNRFGRMRSNTNTLLAMVALADVLFLCAMFPHSLKFVRDPRLRIFVLHVNHHITALINACAFASAWLVVAVSVERMTAVRWPLRARTFWTRANLARLVLAIWALCLLSSSHTHFTTVVQTIPRNETETIGRGGGGEAEGQNSTWNETEESETMKTRESNGTRTIQKFALHATIRPGWERVWRVLTTLNVLAGVLAPVVLVLLANLAILDSLGRERRRRDSPLQLLGDHRPSLGQLRRHRRATFNAMVIAATFALCQSPSALVHLWEVCWPAAGRQPLFHSLAVLSNSLVVTGKMANHFLLCLWSAHFRKSVRLVVGDLLGRRRSSATEFERSGRKEEEEDQKRENKEQREEERSGIDMNQQVREVSELREDEQEGKEVEGEWKRKMLGAWQRMKMVMIGGKRKKRSG